MLDPVSEASGELGGALEHVEVGLLGPAGQVGDAVGARVQTDGLTARPRDRFGDQLALGVVQLRRLLIDGDQGVGQLVDERNQLAVGRQPLRNPNVALARCGRSRPPRRCRSIWTV